MSVSQLVVTILGIILAVVGLALLLAAVGLHLLGVSFSPVWAELAIGLVFLAVGVYVARGGSISL